MEMAQEIPTEELREVAHRVARYADPDETSPLGHVRLNTREGVRIWAGTDRFRAGRLIGGSCDPGPDISVPARFLEVPTEVDRVVLELEPAMEQRDDRALTLAAGQVKMTVRAHDHFFPDLDSLRDRSLDAPHYECEIEVAPLADAVAWLAQRAPRFDPEAPPEPISLTLEPNALIISTTYPRFGPVITEVPARCDGGSTLHVNPWYLHQMLLGAPEATARLLVPLNRGLPLWMEENRWSGYLMLVDPLGAVREQLEEMLREGYGLDELIADEDGDYPFTFDDETMYVRLVDGRVPTVQVFGVLVRDVEGTDDLLRELNDINSHVQFARVFWVAGQVLVEAEIVATDLDHSELGTACSVVSRHLTELGPMLRARFGGS